jgi:hypothetical protein
MRLLMRLRLRLRLLVAVVGLTTSVVYGATVVIEAVRLGRRLTAVAA